MCVYKRYTPVEICVYRKATIVGCRDNRAAPERRKEMRPSMIQRQARRSSLRVTVVYTGYLLACKSHAEERADVQYSGSPAKFFLKRHATL